MIQTINKSNVSEVIAFLAEGFPTTSSEFWKTGIAKIQSYDCHSNGDAPVGYVMYSKGDISGVGLTPTRVAICPRTKKSTKVVNLSSWHVVDSQRWKLPLLLRAMMADKEATYTDLSPAPDMQLVLQKMGFLPINDGVSAVFTPLYSIIGARQNTIDTWDASQDYGFSEDRTKLVSDHVRFGCLAFVIEQENQSHPMIVKVSKIKGLNVAQVVFLEDQTLLKGALGRLCSHLIRAGCLTLFIDLPVEWRSISRVPGLRFQKKYRKFATHDTPPAGTDYTYSELVYFDR